MHKFNFIIARYREDILGSISCYKYASEINYGTIEDAQKYLKYAQKQEPFREYKIFKVTELKNEKDSKNFEPSEKNLGITKYLPKKI